MKKIILYFILIIPLYSAHSEGIINIQGWYGTFGFGTSFTNDNKLCFEYNCNLGYIHFNNRLTGLGIKLIPVQFKSSFIIDDTISDNFDYCLLSFIMPELYWNILDFPFKINKNAIDRNLIFGPFINYNWLNWINFNSFGLNNNYYEIGLKYIFQYEKIDCISFEAGYNNINKSYFIRINIDVTMPMLFYIFGLVFF